MKFKSIRLLLAHAKETLERFPLVMASAIVATIAGIILTNQPYGAQHRPLYLMKLLMSCTLGIPLFLSLKVFIETQGIKKPKAWIFQGMGLFLLAFYYFLLPGQLKGADGMVYALLESDLHLLVAIAPFLFMSGTTNAFWQYNRVLFLRIILSFIYSNTIFIGLAIALGVTGYLFSIKIDYKVYTYLWLSVIGIFNTWFFLSGVPGNVKHLEQDRSYPEGLRIFTQFVLIPLLLLYLAILYLYMGKIILNWSLPHGWLSSFIIGVAIFGILTLLLVHPLTDKKEYVWFRIYKKYFYLALFPLIVLMVVAISRRISDYGITEQRYFVLLFAIWLLAVALRFTFKPQSNIRSIPLTLFLLITLAISGPWSAVSVSKHSQMALLKNILTANGLLAGKQLHKATKPLKYQVNRDVTSIVAYLDRNFGLQILEQWFAPSVKINWKNVSVYDFVTKFLGLDYDWNNYMESPGGNNGYFFFTTASSNNQPIMVSGYDYYRNFYAYGNGGRFTDKIVTPQGALEIKLDPEDEVLEIDWPGHLVPVVKFSQSWMAAMRQKQQRSHYLPVEAATYKGLDSGVSYKVMLQNISGTLQKDGAVKVRSIQGGILFAWTKRQHEGSL